MRLLLDSANALDVERFCGSWAVGGVTTNPSLINLSPDVDRARTYLEMVQMLLDSPGFLRWRNNDEGWHLSLEVVEQGFERMREQALLLHRSHVDRFPNLHVKVPVTVENLPLIHSLQCEGVKVNATACMTALQAKMAQDAGASVVSFFYNRMKDWFAVNDSQAGALRATKELHQFCRVHRTTARVICGSIRTVEDVTECVNQTVNYVTCPPRILEQIVDHPKTAEAIAKFEKDSERWRA